MGHTQTHFRHNIQSYLSKIENCGKALKLQDFQKTIYDTENYLYSFDDIFLYEFGRFRTLNHKLPIDSGRWQNVDRTCIRICNM